MSSTNISRQQRRATKCAQFKANAARNRRYLPAGAAAVLYPDGSLATTLDGASLARLCAAAAAQAERFVKTARGLMLADAVLPATHAPTLGT